MLKITYIENQSNIKNHIWINFRYCIYYSLLIVAFGPCICIAVRTVQLSGLHPVAEQFLDFPIDNCVKKDISSIIMQSYADKYMVENLIKSSRSWWFWEYFCQLV